MTMQAFVSYARKDSQFALRLVDDLKAANASVWLDQTDIDPGERWDTAIEHALKTSPMLLVVLSPDSVSSTNVQDEVALALEEQKTVIPVLYRDCSIPFRLRRLQYVDFRSDYARGLKRLTGILAEAPELVAPMSSDGTSFTSAPIPAAPVSPQVQPVATPPAPAVRRWPSLYILLALASLVVGIAVFSGPIRSLLTSSSSGTEEPSQQSGAPANAAGQSEPPTTTKLAPTPSTVPHTEAGSLPAAVQPPDTKPISIDSDLERNYLGRHLLGVNRVGNVGDFEGSVNITKTDGKLHLSGSSREGVHYLDISGTVEPVSSRKFFLDGEISGIPDLGWRNTPPTKVSTRGRFMFEATQGRRYWRMYQVNGVDCVCHDDCGNDFCYIDIAFLK